MNHRRRLVSPLVRFVCVCVCFDFDRNGKTVARRSLVKPRENEIEKRVGSQLEKNKIIIIKAKAHHQLLLGEWLVFDSSSVQWDVVQGGWPETHKGNKEQYRQH